MTNTRPKLRLFCAILIMFIVTGTLLADSANKSGSDMSYQSGLPSIDSSADPRGYPLANGYPEPLGDYIPCMFDRNQLFTLRSLAPPKDGKEAAKKAALSEVNRLTPGLVDRFTQEMIANPLESGDPSEVAAKIYSNATAAGLPKTDAQSVSDKGKEGAESVQYKRPADIGCAMTIYPWKEASDNFGRRVADSFIAIQVTVRNLNPNLEFLLHDAELAADANMSGLSRFQSSHERRIVRNVGQVGQVWDKRNVAVRIMEGIGMIAGSATGFAPSGYALGYSVYSAGVIPAVKHVLPDMTQDNLNNISDFAFTSSWSSRIVVPKSGAVTFVTFIPSSPLEQACWLQDSYDVIKDVSYGTPLNACAPEPKPGQGKDKSLSDAWKTIAYKNWNAIQQQALMKHAYAVIAGVHIQEVHNATVTKLDCPVLKDGTADLSKAQNGQYSCVVTGTDLDSVTSVTLTQATSTVNGKWVASNDKKSGQAQFAVSELNGLSGDYSLNLIYTSGESSASGQSLKFGVRSPGISEVTFDTTDLGKAKNNTVTMTLKGSDLDRIASVKLTSDAGAEYAGTLASDIKQTDSSATATFNSATLSGAANHSLSMSYTTKDKPGTDVKASSKGLPVTFTDSAKASDSKPAPKKGAAAPASAAKKKAGIQN